MSEPHERRLLASRLGCAAAATLVTLAAGAYVSYGPGSADDDIPAHPLEATDAGAEPPRQAVPDGAENEGDAITWSMKVLPKRSHGPARTIPPHPTYVQDGKTGVFKYLTPSGGCDGLGDDTWNGCQGDGCRVCVEKVAGFDCYFENHPDCMENTGCGVKAFDCDEACPEPTEADRCIDRQPMYRPIIE